MMYDEKRRMIKLSAVPGERNLYRQKGIYEKLLCNDCEQIINKFEKHVKHVFYDEMHHQETGNTNEIKLIDLDYDNVKLFQLSLLWRASIASNPFFESVKLGRHEEKIRNMIISRNPGDVNEYGCIIIGLYTKEVGTFDAIIKPERGRVEGHYAYRFVLGSNLWLYLVSKHTNLFERKKYFLQKNGTMILKFFPAEKAPFILKMIDNLRKTGKLA
ncbi:MAG: hypothetical protein AB1746_09110 [Candidatus Zixiibacteriota bacterium]